MKRTPLSRLNLLVGYYMPMYILMLFACHTLIAALDAALTPNLDETLIPRGIIYIAAAFLAAIPLLTFSLAAYQTINYLCNLNGRAPEPNTFYIYPNDIIFLVLGIVYTLMFSYYTDGLYLFQFTIKSNIISSSFIIDLRSLISLFCIALVLFRQLIISAKTNPIPTDPNTEP